MQRYIFEQFGLLTGWLLTLGIQSIRYFLIAGTMFLIFYLWQKRSFFHRKIQQKFPKNSHIQREIAYSVLTMAIFAGFAIGIYFAQINGYTQIYGNVNTYGWGYWVFSLILLVFAHDTYFYWTHRLMHHPRLYKMVHRVHHLSHNPTPFAAFAFHPLEAVMEFGISLIIFIFPFHHLVLFVFATLSFFMNVLGHLGYELMPKNFPRHRWFGAWQNTATHHNMHHERVNCNYGLYFNFWDNWMGTNHPDYLTKFDEVKNRPHAQQIEQLA